MQALWFTGAVTSTIGRRTTSGEVSVYPTPTFSSYPEGIAQGQKAYCGSLPKGKRWNRHMGRA
jgi:streptogramin lyase